MNWRVFYNLLLTMAAKPVYGGQAVVQGVMMKGPNHYAVSVRTSKGIITKVTRHTSFTKKHWVLGLPFIRGIVTLVDMLIIGYKSIYYSADVAMEEEETDSSALSTWALVGTMLFSLAFAIFLFKFLPLGTATLIDKAIPLSTFVFNLVDGVVKAGIFLLYLYLVGRYKDMQELFRYHGAEHKSINCYEQGKPLTLPNIFAQSTVHKRCGTTFMFVVLFISLLVYLFIPKDLPFFLNLGLRLALLPVIAGISYELQRYSATHSNFFLNLLLAPGLALQSLTVLQPNAKQVKTGKAALEAVLSADS
ncbi:MAG: DUF1385 domain-containing protein [Nanoarchaeota archaeon]|nr:DUF1385 domain-containing protein [Nanoarchaeota archaeon]